MSKLKWQWVYYPYLDAPTKQEESALKAGYIKVVVKDDADKVIAEKDNELRHHKFKRCLAMAKWCMTEYIQSKCLDFTNTEQWYWRRWHIRWRNLAKKFKEAK